MALVILLQADDGMHALQNLEPASSQQGAGVKNVDRPDPLADRML